MLALLSRHLSSRFASKVEQVWFRKRDFAHSATFFSMEIDGENVIKRAAEAGDVDVQGESRKRSRIHNVPVESDSNAGVEEARNEASAQETAEFSKDVPGPSQKKELKQKKNAGRRRGTRREPESVTENGQDSAEKEPRLPKRLCALLIGYSGSGYNGMQMYVTDFCIRVMSAHFIPSRSSITVNQTCGR